MPYTNHDGCTIDFRTGECIGWHCHYCGAPCSSQGHFECLSPQAIYKPE